MMKNKVKTALENCRVTLGSWIQLGPYPAIAEVMADCGFDWLSVDGEHSDIDVEGFTNLARGMQRNGCVPLVRVRENDTLVIRQMLDAGAQGVIVPLINTAEEALRYADSVNSPNLGIHLDTYHMNIEEDNIGAAIRLVGNRLRHFHTGENNRNIPGRGHLDWEEIFRALSDIGYRKDIVSEPFLQMGGEVGYDIRVWRPILKNPTEERLDAAAAELLGFTKSMLTKFGMD